MRRRSLAVWAVVAFAVMAACRIGWSAEATGQDAELTTQTIVRDLKPGETHTYRLHTAAGTRFLISAKQLGVDLLLALKDPEGRAVIEVDGPFRDGLAEELFFVAEAAGTFLVEVRHADRPHVAGRYELRLLDTGPAEARDYRRFEAAKVMAEAHRLMARATGDAWRAAIPLLRTALEHWRALGDRRLEGETLNFLGSLHRQLGERQLALEEHAQAAVCARDVGDRLQEIVTLENVAKAYLDVGESRRAAERYQQVLELARLEGAHVEECAIETKIGEALHVLGEAQDALEYLTRAVSLCSTIDDRSAATRSAFETRARVYRDLGLYERAMEDAQEAVNAARAQNFPFQVAIALTELAELQRLQGEPARSLATLEAALSPARISGQARVEASVLTQLGTVLLEQGDTVSATDHLDRAVELLATQGSPSARAAALIARGDLRLSTARREDARLDFEHALQLARGSNHVHLEAAALYGLARAARDSNHLEDASARSEEAVAVAESLRANVLSQQSRAEYLATVRPYYELAVEVLMTRHRAQPEAGYDRRALQMSERARARSLQEGLLASAAANAAGTDPELLRRERTLRERVNGHASRLFRLTASDAEGTPEAAEVRRELETLLDELQALEGRLVNSRPVQSGFVDVDELQRRIPDDRSVLLVYALGARRSFVWAVSRASFATRELAPRAHIEDLVKRYSLALTARNAHPRFETPTRRLARLATADADAADLGRQLSEVLLLPVISDIAGRRLLVVADGGLHRLPFAALPAPGEDSVRPRSAGGLREPFFARQQIVYVPSAASLVFWQTRTPPSRAAKTLAVFADPVFSPADPRVRPRAGRPRAGAGDRGFSRELTRAVERSGVARAGQIPRLPYTRFEGRALLALASPVQRKAAFGFEANRRAALDPALSAYRFVHFATHGVIDEAQPGLSGMVLSLVDRDGREQDGFLRAQDASAMRLGADLVSLSGCSTALGRAISGEGVLGLSHGFLRAGARRVLVSLWDVDDRATAWLMVELYKSLLGRDHRSAAESLRRAQAKMRLETEWRAPYFWAAFVLIGDPSDDR